MEGLAEHLRAYGIRRLAAKEYRQYRQKFLANDVAREVDHLRCLRSAKGQLRFYEFIANPLVAGVVHSTKAEAIAASGRAVQERIVGRKRVLDLGCNIGYLTTWYARIEPDRQAVGVDVSPTSIALARQMTRELGIAHVEFHTANVESWLPDGQFDAVVDTQTLAYTKLDRALPRIRDSLTPDGVLVSVAPLSTEEEARRYLNALQWAGLVVQSFEMIYHVDLNLPGAYAVIVATKSGEPIAPDLHRIYREASEKLDRMIRTDGGEDR